AAPSVRCHRRPDWRRRYRCRRRYRRPPRPPSLGPPRPCCCAPLPRCLRLAWSSRLRCSPSRSNGRRQQRAVHFEQPAGLHRGELLMSCCYSRGSRRCCWWHERWRYRS
ncbi:unnamed protein product, partial [Ectocarpus sp. 12 AP-2014]